MKKLIAILLIVVLSVSVLSGCSETDELLERKEQEKEDAVEVNPMPTEELTAEPTVEVTAEPTAEPTPEATEEPTPDPTQPPVSQNPSLLDYADMTYDEIRQIDWDDFSFYDSFDSPGEWYAICMKGDVSVNFSFIGEVEDTSALPVFVSVSDCRNGEAKAPITKDFTTGMTYGEISRVEDVSELKPAELGGSEYMVTEAYFYPEQGCIVTLYFRGTDENATLVDTRLDFLNNR